MWGGSDDAESIAAIRSSVDAGITLIDTAPAYGKGRSEELVGKALRGRRDEVTISTKCGLVWSSDGSESSFDPKGASIQRHLDPKSVRREIEQSLTRLDTDVIDIYHTHWPDPTTPIADTMETLTALKEEGKIRAIAASNVSLEDIREYSEAGELSGIQESYSALERGLDDEIAPHCKAQQISIMSYSSLALGILSGKILPDRVFEGDDQRIEHPRFSVQNRANVLLMLAELDTLRLSLGLTTAQLVIAWTLVQPGITYSLVGARNVAQATENAEAGDVELTNDAVALIDRVFKAKASSLK